MSDHVARPEEEPGPAIGDLENETIYEPSDEDDDPEAFAQMQMGKADQDPENDLRDPFFHTEEGQAWLAEHEDATAAADAEGAS